MLLPCGMQGGDENEAQLIAIRNMAMETDGITWRDNSIKVCQPLTE